MTNVNLFGKDWTNIVFDGRNKMYGAYKLREESGKNTLLALAIGIGCLTSVAALSYFYSSQNIVELIKPNVSPIDPTVVIVDLQPKDEPKPIIEKTETQPTVEASKAGATTNVQELKEFKNIVANKDHLANSNLAAQNEFTDEITSGQTTAAADLKNGNLKSGGEATGTAIGANNQAKTNTGGNGAQTLNTNEIVRLVQVKAKPVDGFEKFYEAFVRKFHASNFNGAATQVTVKLRFVVEKDGSFTDIQILDDKYGIGNEAIKVIKQMPKWQPAVHNNQKVRSMFTLPITIKINN